jgi:hypothetical protein
MNDTSLAVEVIFRNPIAWLLAIYKSPITHLTRRLIA